MTLKTYTTLYSYIVIITYHTIKYKKRKISTGYSTIRFQNTFQIVINKLLDTFLSISKHMDRKE